MGSWMKIEHDTVDKLEVIKIGEMLELSQEAVFGHLFRLWSWYDKNTENGHAPSVTGKNIDVLAHAPGLAEAMQTVGWLVVNEDGAFLPHFDRHNGQTAKKRALSARRKAKQREISHATSHANVTQPVTPNAPLDKRRIEVKEKGTTVPPKKARKAAAAVPEYAFKFMKLWNQTEGVSKCVTMSPNRCDKLRTRMKETLLIEGKPMLWLEALAVSLPEKFPLAFKGSGGDWKPDVDWLLRPGTLIGIIEGKYDWQAKLRGDSNGESSTYNKFRALSGKAKS